MIEVLTKIGVHTVRASDESLEKCMQLIGFLAELPDYCPVCARGNGQTEGNKVPVSLFFRETQEGHTYYGLRCKALGKDAHETSFGRLKKTGKSGPFWYKGEWHRVGEYNKPEDDREPSRGGSNQARGEFEG